MASANTRWIKRLVWAYFWLLLLEGALRKWVVPSLSNPLLIVRDPIVIAAYVLAIRARIFPYNRWVTACILLAFLSLFAGLYILQDAPLVALFGFRTDFLSLPLIFIIPLVFDFQDVRKIGFWTLVMCLPMALLMVLQFVAPSTSFLNAGAGVGGGQISAGGGHVRPAGTFSFISGPATFFPFVTAFLISSQLAKTRYPRWLLAAATFALLLATVVSSSRGLAASVVVVLGCAFVAGVFLQPVLVSSRVVMRAAGGLLAVGFIAFLVTQMPVFSAGLETFSARVQVASNYEGGGQGFISRGLSGFTAPLEFFADTPLLGRGLGMGTNAGSALITGGQATFLLAEGEWARVILESGPLLGSVYLLLRVFLAVWLGVLAAQVSKQGNALPFLLFASCLTPLVNGQFGQPTELGFAVLGAGLTLAAMRSPAAPLTDAQAAHSAGTQTIGQSA